MKRRALPCKCAFCSYRGPSFLHLAAHVRHDHREVNLHDPFALPPEVSRVAAVVKMQPYDPWNREGYSFYGNKVR